MTTLSPRIYLASRSPRRQELLKQVAIPFYLLPFRGGEREDAAIDEKSLSEENPVAYATRLALAKAEHGARIVSYRHFAVQPVLAADTTLEFEGKIIGKPENKEDAYHILQQLSGKTHRVITAVSLTLNGKSNSQCSISEVRFRELSHGEISEYVATGEPLDKAGAYGIQGRAALFIEHISGSYSGIMGLPLFETGLLLKQLNQPPVSLNTPR